MYWRNRHFPSETSEILLFIVVGKEAISVGGIFHCVGANVSIQQHSDKMSAIL